ncbi:mannonate dehydratase [Salinispira pacifica]
MKVGFGLYSHMLTKDFYRFARQCGATHVVVHLVDYTAGSSASGANQQPVGDTGGWGVAGTGRERWSLESLLRLKRELAEEGLTLEAIENFDPADWYDILLDGPHREEQMTHLKKVVQTVGEAGIPILGYNFSLAGVASRTTGPFARGGAQSVAMTEVDERPLPRGMVWNMVYDREAYGDGSVAEPRATVSHDELWRRLTGFLEELVPVAEAAGVRLAAHPDDPPAARVRGTPRLVYRPDLYQKLIDAVPSRSNGLEFCLGTIAEMADGDLYDAVDTYARQGAIAYVHFRNVHGKVPQYHETFIDEGDIDFSRVVRILERNGFDGMLIPDHAPDMTCDAPWHAGMAFAMGYISALLQSQGVKR